MVIRKALSTDAESILALLRDLIEEPRNNLLIASEPFTATVEDEIRMIEELTRSPNSTMLVAEEAGDIVGCLTARGGKRPCNRHEAVVGVSVRRDFRGRGIGTLLMRRMIRWAEDTGLRRIELTVYSRNQAIRLYERLGFQLEGTRRRAFLHDGEWIDAVVMGMLLD